MVDTRGNPSPARLSVRITQDSMSAGAGDPLGQTQTSAKKLWQPLVSNVSGKINNISGAIINISDSLSNEQNLMASFNALMKKFTPLVKIGDEVAKVRSSVSFLHWTI